MLVMNTLYCANELWLIEPEMGLRFTGRGQQFRWSGNSPRSCPVARFPNTGDAMRESRWSMPPAEGG